MALATIISPPSPSTCIDLCRHTALRISHPSLHGQEAFVAHLLYFIEYLLLRPVSSDRAISLQFTHVHILFLNTNQPTNIIETHYNTIIQP